MAEVKSLVEKLARELCRWDREYSNDDEMWLTWEDSNEDRRDIYLSEARKIVKMVCSSRGLASPLMVKGKGE